MVSNLFFNEITTTMIVYWWKEFLLYLFWKADSTLCNIWCFEDFSFLLCNQYADWMPKFLKVEYMNQNIIQIQFNGKR